jgi:acetyl esterase/lipase
MLEVVPYPLPLEQPPRNLQFVSRRFRTLAASTWRGESPASHRWIDTRADIVLCRDAWRGLMGKLPPCSVVVVGRRAGFWPLWTCREERLAKRLRDAGHHVVRACATAKEA